MRSTIVLLMRVTGRRVNEWLIHRMDETPFHKHCYNSSETIAALLNVNMAVAFRLDNQGKMSLEYARDYNVGGLVGMINGLCNHRHAA